MSISSSYSLLDSDAGCREEDIVLAMPVVTLDQTIEAHTSDINSVCFTNDLLASGGGDKDVRLWEYHTTVQAQECTYSPLTQGHTYSVHCVQFSPNQRWLATSSIDGRVILWDSKTGAKLSVYDHRTKAIIRVCRFTSNGRHIVTGSSDESLCLWDVANKQAVRTYEGHESPVNTISITPDDAYMISGSSNGDIAVWSIQYAHTKPLQFTDNAHDLGVNASSCSNVPLCSDGKPCDSTTPTSSTSTMRYQFITGGMDHLVKVWRLKATPGTTQVHVRHTATLSGHAGPIMDVKYSYDSSWIASASNDKTVRLWAVATMTCAQTIEAHSRYVTCCAFSPDTMYLATGSNDKLIKIWKFTTDQQQLLAGTTADSITSPATPRDSRTSSSGAACTSSVHLSITSDSSSPLDHMTTSAVCDWLRDVVGLQQYVQCFHDNDIDGAELSRLTAQTLKDDLNIEVLGHRNKIVRGIEDLKSQYQQSALLDVPVFTDDTGMDDEFLCPVTREVMRDPVIASDGYTYERSAIESWISNSNKTSPMTNEPLTSHVLTPNRNLLMLINRAKQTTSHHQTSPSHKASAGSSSGNKTASTSSKDA